MHRFGASLALAVLTTACGTSFAAVVKVDATVPTLTVSPNPVPTSGSNVTVSWSGVANPSHLDYIGVYAPSSAEDMDMISLVPCGEARSEGSVSFPIVHIHGSDHEFRYWNGGSPRGPLKTRVIAKTGSVTFADPLEPVGGHLSLGDAEGTMVLSWSSADPSPGLVRFTTRSASGGTTNGTAGSTARTYGPSDMCGAPANTSEGFRWPGYLHTAVIGSASAPIVEGDTVAYTYGSASAAEGGPGRSRRYSFAGYPARGAPSRAIIYGDQGVGMRYGHRGAAKVYPAAGQTAEWVGDAVAAGMSSMVLLIGDISYARGHAWQWSQFFDENSRTLHAVPLHVGMGNHEYDHPTQPFKPSWADYGSDSGGECGVPYAMRFRMPGEGVASRNHYYSFDHGLVHHIVISSETDFLPGSPQYEFVTADLAAVNTSVTPFIALSSHRPFYTSFSHPDEGELMANLVSTYEPLCVKFKVSVVFFGHVHMYERMARMVDGVENDNGPVYLLVGGGGNNDQASEIMPQPSWSLVRSYDYGFGRLTAFNSESLLFEYVTDKNGEVLDKYWIHGSENTM